jgi:3-phenylpropionate/cinnamic acid dioxygenase small subunit
MGERDLGTDEGAALRVLLDERAILRTLHRYCRALDYGVVDEWLDCFTEDARYETVLPNGDAWAKVAGHAELAAFLAEYPRPPVQSPRHVMVDPVIDIDGDEASVEAAFLFLTQVPDEQPKVVAWGRYQDRLVRQGSAWRFSERICVTEANLL